MDDTKVAEMVALAGDSVKDAILAQGRLVRRAKLRALVAKRKYERTKTQEDEHNYMLSAQEFYYMAALAADFRKAALQVVAQLQADKTEKNGNLN